VRQILLEVLIINGEAEDELYRGIRDTHAFRYAISEVALTRRDFETILKRLDQLPPSPSTEVRLELERIGGGAIQMKNKVQQLLKLVRDANQSTPK
jgi:hypothetical protein